MHKNFVMIALAMLFSAFLLPACPPPNNYLEPPHCGWPDEFETYYGEGTEYYDAYRLEGLIASPMGSGYSEYVYIQYTEEWKEEYKLDVNSSAVADATSTQDIGHSTVLLCYEEDKNRMFIGNIGLGLYACMQGEDYTAHTYDYDYYYSDTWQNTINEIQVIEVELERPLVVGYRGFATYDAVDTMEDPGFLLSLAEPTPGLEEYYEYQLSLLTVQDLGNGTGLEIRIHPFLLRDDPYADHLRVLQSDDCENELQMFADGTFRHSNK